LRKYANRHTPDSHSQRCANSALATGDKDGSLKWKIPTWNYQAVHVYGQCKVFKDPDELRELVGSLTSKYESAFARPWQPEYNAIMLGAIVGIEVVISEIRCKYKLSQNRSAQDQQQVIQQLKGAGSNRLARAMERNEQ